MAASETEFWRQHEVDLAHDLLQVSATIRLHIGILVAPPLRLEGAAFLELDSDVHRHGWSRDGRVEWLSLGCKHVWPSLRARQCIKTCLSSSASAPRFVVAINRDCMSSG